MSNDEFETWLSLVGRLLGLSERQREQIGEELRDHLESRVADLLESGMDKQSAVMQAVEEFGDAAVLAKNLQSVSLVNRKRWMMRFMTLATAGLFMVALLTMAMWPQDARFGSPSQSVAQDKDPLGSGDGDATNKNPFAKGGGASIAEASIKPADAPKPSARSMSNMEIREKLKQPFDLVYDADPFGDVKVQLAQDLKLNIVVDQNLEGELDNDTEISVNLAGVRLSDGLRMMLKSVDATYTIKNGVLLIISIDDEGEPDFLARHMIDVREILKLIKATEADRIGKPMITVPTVAGGFGGGGRGGEGRGGGGGVFCIAQGLGVEPPSQLVVTQKASQEKKKESKSATVFPVLTAERLLVDTIANVVSTDAWEVTGGGNCVLTCIGGVLVVVSNEAVADDVRDFITDLEYEIKNRKD